MRAVATALSTHAVACSARAGVCPMPLFVYMPNHTQVNRSSPGSEGNKYGLEDGIVVRRADGGFSMVATEMYGDPMWVPTRLGVYRSVDGLAWHRRQVLRNSTAIFDGTDQHSATFGSFFVYDPANRTWALSYVGYRTAPENSSGFLKNFRGTIFSRYARLAGDEGLDSDFREDNGR
eukprot:gene6148-5992_t